MNDRHRHLALPSFPQYAGSLTGMLHTNGYKLKSLLLESAVASSFASLPAYFENAKVYTNAMLAYVNATKPLLHQAANAITSYLYALPSQTRLQAPAPIGAAAGGKGGLQMHAGSAKFDRLAPALPGGIETGARHIQYAASL